MAGCCKEFCGVGTLAVSFEKFRAIEADTVGVEKYQPGIQFSTSSDTIRSTKQYLPAIPAIPFYGIKTCHQPLTGSSFFPRLEKSWRFGF